MFRNNKAVKGFLAGGLAGLVLALVALPVFALDIGLLPQRDAAPRVFDGDTSPLVVPAAAFREDGHDYGPTNYFFSFSGGHLRGGYTCQQAPVYLPDGAVVDEVFASVYDDDAASSILITVYRVNKNTGATDTMAGMSTSAAFNSTDIEILDDASISQPEIDYPTYAYYVSSCLGSNDIRLYSVRFYYTHETATYLPILMKNWP